MDNDQVPRTPKSIKPKSVGDVGQRFGMLVLVTKLEQPPKTKARWECRCDCGELKVVLYNNLQSGHTKSCGCLKFTWAASALTTHGLSESPEYKIWRQIKSRCFREKDDSYPSYGGRGITLYPEWRDNFLAFYEYLGPRPSPGHSIDRIDVNGNYEPGNIRWATRVQQANNKRRHKYVVWNGVTLTLAELCRNESLSYFTIHARLRLGWTLEEAIHAKPWRREESK